MILALVFTVSCKKKDNDKNYSFKMSKVNLNGAKYLALGAKEGSKDGETGGFLYSVDENGNLQIMAYEYECDDSGVASELKQNLTVSITAMIPVGDVYIWLMGWDDTNWPSMRCIGGKYFVSVCTDDNNEGTIYRVDIDGDAATGTAVATGYFIADPCEMAQTLIYVSDEENYSWPNCETLYTFNANT